MEKANLKSERAHRFLSIEKTYRERTNFEKAQKTEATEVEMRFSKNLCAP